MHRLKVSPRRHTPDLAGRAYQSLRSLLYLVGLMQVPRLVWVSLGAVVILAICRRLILALGRRCWIWTAGCATAGKAHIISVHICKGRDQSSSKRIQCSSVLDEEDLRREETQRVRPGPTCAGAPFISGLAASICK